VRTEKEIVQLLITVFGSNSVNPCSSATAVYGEKFIGFTKIKYMWINVGEQLLVQLPPKVTASSGHALCKCLLYKNECILSDGPHLPKPCFFQ
jgi:hypothetical protein